MAFIWNPLYQFSPTRRFGSVAGAREGDLHLLGYGFHDTWMPSRLLCRRGPASDRAHHLHVVQASTRPSRNQLLLRDSTRAKTELIRELTDKARAERRLCV
jgi:hypothetical protein